MSTGKFTKTKYRIYKTYFFSLLTEQSNLLRMNNHACWIYKMVQIHLERTDAAGRVPHLRPTRLPAHRCRVCFFFFFFFSSDSGRIGFNSCRIRLIRPESGRIGHIKSYWPATDTAETGRKRPKSALKLAGNRQNSDLKGVSCLPLSLFCESRYSNVFFKNILIENINKNIFNNFLIAESRRTRTRTHLFQKLPSPAPAPESRNAPVLHSFYDNQNRIFTLNTKQGLNYIPEQLDL